MLPVTVPYVAGELCYYRHPFLFIGSFTFLKLSYLISTGNEGFYLKHGLFYLSVNCNY